MLLCKVINRVSTQYRSHGGVMENDQIFWSLSHLLSASSNYQRADSPREERVHSHMV